MSSVSKRVLVFGPIVDVVLRHVHVAFNLKASTHDDDDDDDNAVDLLLRVWRRGGGVSTFESKKDMKMQSSS